MSEKYWDIRSETYDDLDDVKSKRTSYKIVDVLKGFSLNKNARIIDVGCASGMMTKTIRDNFRGSCVLGIDISENMIARAKLKERDGLSFEKCDVLELTSEFDIALMSLVMHHLTGGKDKEAVNHIYSNILSDRGHMVIAEAIPPSDEIFDYYSYIFSIKEKRNCYKKEDLIFLMRSAGFLNVKAVDYRFDIRLNSWLNDKTLSNRKKKLLRDLHINAPSKFIEAYNMRQIKNRDYILSCKMAIVYGEKS